MTSYIRRPSSTTVSEEPSDDESQQTSNDEGAESETDQTHGIGRKHTTAQQRRLAQLMRGGMNGDAADEMVDEAGTHTPTTNHPTSSTTNNQSFNSTIQSTASKRPPPHGYINFSPRKLRLPEQHQPWGVRYEHPTLLSPSGKPLEIVHPPPPPISTTLTDILPIPPSPTQKKKTVSMQPTGEEKTSMESSHTSDDTYRSRVLQQSRAQREAAQVNQITSKLINTVAPPATLYTAFSEASRYHDIIHPPISPRSLLLSKLAAPEVKPNGRVLVPTTVQKEGLPVQPREWHITAKMKEPRPSASGTVLTDGFDATLAERDSRLYGASGPVVGVLKAPGSDPAQRTAERLRRIKAKRELAEQQARALEMGLLPGNGTSSAWSALELTPRPRTSNDSRGRKEVLRMLDAFRHTPKGVQVLAQKEQQREHQREMIVAAKWEQETGEKLIPPVPMRNLSSAPSGQQHTKVPGFSPRSFSRAQGHTSSHGFNSARSATSQGFNSTQNSFGQSMTTRNLTTPGFFPSAPTASNTYPSSFHQHLSQSHRSAGGSSNGLAPSTASFLRVHPPAFMNTPNRVETLQMTNAKLARERIRVGASLSESDEKFKFSGRVVKDKKQALAQKELHQALELHQSTPYTARSALASRSGVRTSHGSRPSESEEKDSTSREPPPQPTPPPTLPLPSELDFSSTMAMIRDYSVRALACNRAGRRSAEANTYFCQGVLYDNIQQYHKAIESYKKFKDILCGPKPGQISVNHTNFNATVEQSQSGHNFLRTAEDTFAESLAHNSLGVSYQNLGLEYYESAIYHHARHRDIGDIPGQFIAFTNLGLIYQLMAAQAAGTPIIGLGSTTNMSQSQQANQVHIHPPSSTTNESNYKAYTELAAYNHQQALRCAIKMSSLAGQNIAIGNLGLTGLQHHDLQTARVCMERHLQLSQNLDDYRGQSSAYQTLGTIASQQGQHEEAMIFFQSAGQMAHVLKDTNTVDQAKVQVGVAKANAQMDLAMRRMAELMTNQQGSYE